MSTVTLSQLHYLVAVATHGHFGHAAAACGVTQPTLSMQIQKAEQQLGVVIFDRTQTPVIVTEIGTRVIAQARITLREAARLVELCDDRQGMIVGMLRVGLLPTLGPYLLPRLVATLAARFPGLQLVVEELLTATIIARLREETLDIGLIATPAIALDILQWPLFTEPLVGYVHCDHPLSRQAELRIADIVPQDLWLLSEAHCLGQQTRELCRLSAEQSKECLPFVLQIQFESGSLEMLKQMVEQNGGVTLLPALCVNALHAAPPTARIIPCATPTPTREISLVSRRAYVKQHLVEAFVGTVLESLPQTIHQSTISSSGWRIQAPGASDK
ncbi:MAG: hydrogen peroxide-inducible genes activator [Roseiflexaceae bacterium]